MKALLVIPAYNEADNIVEVVRTIENAGYDYVVVNDGSRDDTLAVCHTHGINVIDLGINLGIGGAVQTGHKYALTHGYDVDIQVDGDGQHDISYIPSLLAKMEEGYDLVIGSRFLGEGEGFQSTGMRRLGISWLSKAIKQVCGLRITDATSGFRATGKRALKLYCRYYPTDYPEPESIVSAAKAGLRVAEVPVVMRERQGGTSSISPLRGAYYMIKVLLAIYVVGSRRQTL